MTGPALALAATIGTLAALELGTRAMLSAPEQRRLLHVGLDPGEDARLRWMERRRSAHRTGMAFDVPDPLLGWRPRPGIDRIRVVDGRRVRITTSAHGLRGADAPGPARTAGVPRVAVFGCSQTFGGHVDDADVYTARVARLLPGTEVLNFGVHGYGTGQMLLRWETEGIGFTPDVVVLAFAYYHVSRNVSGFRFYAKPRFLLAADGAPVLGGVPVPAPDAVARRPPPQPMAVLDRLVVLRWLWDRAHRRREAALYRADSDAWALTEALITRFAQSAQAHGARFLLLNVGEEAPVMEAAAASLAGRLGVEWVDSHERFEALRGAGVPLRVANDPHWGPDAHAALAASLAGALCGDAALPTCGAVHAAVHP